MENCSIYAIVNVCNGKSYVGSSVRMRARINKHFLDLRLGRHYNDKLQKAFDKYGESAFKVEKLDECFVSERAAVETTWIKRLNSVHNGYNICHNGMSVLGTPQSEEHVARRVASKKGYTHSDETRDKLSEKAKMRGVEHMLTEEALAKKAAALVGKKHSPETRAKLSEIAKNRSPQSEETRRKKSETMKAVRAERFWSTGSIRRSRSK